jgi:hypothetical protein
VYALGVILYQLVVGDLNRPLVPGWERAVPDPLLCADIALATDGDPARRLGSAGDLAGRVRGLAARHIEVDQRQAAVAADAAHSMQRRARGRRLWLVASVLAVATVLGVAAMISQKGAIARDTVQEDRALLKSFYAEVMDVYRHYLYTDEELVSDPAAEGFRLQLNLAMYGESPFTRGQIDEIGLAPGEIPLVMELLLLIRNNDLRIANVLEDRQSDPQSVGRQIETLRKRVKDTRDTAYSILASLHKREQQLGELPPQPPG